MRTIGLVEDKRPQYAAALREMADRVEASDKQPEGMFVHVFMVQGELAMLRRMEDGFNLMHAIGCLDIQKQDLGNAVLSAQKRI